MISQKAFCYNHKQEPFEFTCSELACKEKNKFYCIKCLPQAIDHSAKHPVLRIDQFTDIQAIKLQNKLDSTCITEGSLDDNIRSVKSQIIIHVNRFKNNIFKNVDKMAR